MSNDIGCVGAYYPHDIDDQKITYRFNLACNIALSISLVAISILLVGAIAMAIPMTASFTAAALVALGGVHLVIGLLAIALLSSLCAFLTHYANSNQLSEYSSQNRYTHRVFEDGEYHENEINEPLSKICALFDFSTLRCCAPILDDDSLDHDSVD